eukprot:GAHX01002205.1.p1 GENE.GAHX01002205.1~~GAHX01002205.1.p1  ORF type:complete len:790 (-),score=133.74 GAHX01002205.1:218-2587(-)
MPEKLPPKKLYTTSQEIISVLDRLENMTIFAKKDHSRTKGPDCSKQRHHNKKPEKSPKQGHTLSDIFERDPLFFINDVPLAIKLLHFITRNHMSVLINESSASGKTSFIDVFTGIIQQDPEKKYLVNLDCENTKEDIAKITETVVPINLNFASIYNTVQDSELIITDFIYYIIKEIIEQVKNQIQLTTFQQNEIDDFSNQANNAKSESFLVLKMIHNQLLLHLIEEVNQKKLKKKTVYQDNITEESNDLTSKHIKKIIFIIDEVNVLELKGVNPGLLGGHRQQCNWYVKMIETAVSPDQGNFKYQCYSFILTSILPISIEREKGYKRIRFNYFSQFLKTLKTGNETAFGEVTYSFYNKIAGAESENKLTTFLRLIRTKKNILEDYLDKTLDDEIRRKEIINSIWKLCFPDCLYEGDKMKPSIILQELINRSYKFFIMLWGQYIYMLKFDTDLLIHTSIYNLNEIDKTGKVFPDRKINTGYFMHFLMNETSKNSISIKQEDNISSEKYMESFWEDYTHFKERYNITNYMINLTIEEIGILCDQSKSVRNNHFERTIRNSYHLGHTSLQIKKINDDKAIKKVQLDDGSSATMIDYKNLQIKLISSNMMKRLYVNDCHRSHIIKLAKARWMEDYYKRCFKKATFNIKFWKDFIASLKEDIASPFLLEGQAFTKSNFENELIPIINLRLRDRISRLTGMHKDSRELEFMVGEAEQQSPFPNKDKDAQNSETARMDIIVELKVEHKTGERFFAIFELKVNYAKLENLSVFTETKNTIRISDSLTKKKRFILQQL